MNTKDVVARVLTGAHEAIFRLTGGRVFGDALGMTVIMLTTTGRRSGARRTVMLTAPVHDGDTFVLVASYGGDDRDPAWFGNLVANPDVEVVTRGAHRQMRARIATPTEKHELWPRVIAAYRGYERYQERTARDIPLVILEPRPPTT